MASRDGVKVQLVGKASLRARMETDGVPAEQQNAVLRLMGLDR